MWAVFCIGFGVFLCLFLFSLQFHFYKDSTLAANHQDGTMEYTKKESWWKQIRKQLVQQLCCCCCCLPKKEKGKKDERKPKKEKQKSRTQPKEELAPQVIPAQNIPQDAEGINNTTLEYENSYLLMGSINVSCR